MNRNISIRPLTEDEIRQSNLHPHAIINKPMSYFEDFGIKFIHDCDDLDEFDAYGFMIEYQDHEFYDHAIPSLLFYRKHPLDNVVNIYFPLNFNERQIELALTKVLAIFELSDEDVYWQQGEYFSYHDNPIVVDRNRKMEKV